MASVVGWPSIKHRQLYAVEGFALCVGLSDRLPVKTAATCCGQDFTSAEHVILPLLA